MKHPEENPRRLWWTLIGILAGCIIAAVLTAVVVTAQIRSSQVDNTAKSDSRDEALAIVKGCVQPQGACNKRNQQRLAGAIADIGAANILTVVCALQVSNGTPLDQALDEVTSCVAERLNATPPQS